MRPCKFESDAQIWELRFLETFIARFSARSRNESNHLCGKISERAKPANNGVCSYSTHQILWDVGEQYFPTTRMTNQLVRISMNKQEFSRSWLQGRIIIKRTNTGNITVMPQTAAALMPNPFGGFLYIPTRKAKLPIRHFVERPTPGAFYQAKRTSQFGFRVKTGKRYFLPVRGATLQNKVAFNHVLTLVITKLHNVGIG